MMLEDLITIYPLVLIRYQTQQINVWRSIKTTKSSFRSL